MNESDEELNKLRTKYSFRGIDLGLLCGILLVVVPGTIPVVVIYMVINKLLKWGKKVWHKSSH